MLKKKQFVIGLLCWLFTSPMQADAITLSGFFEPKDKAAAYIAVLGNIGQKNILGEGKVIDGAFKISIQAPLPEGSYKLVFGMQEKVYFYWVHTGKNQYHLVFKNELNKWRMECTSSEEHSYITKYTKQQDSLLAPMGILYSFMANYPEKKTKLFEDVHAVLLDKIETFKKFRASKIAKAPKYSQEILKQTQIYLYNPLWEERTLEQNFESTFFDAVPKEDSNFYKKPFLGDKLEQFFSATLEDKIQPEAEKYAKIKKKVLLCLEKLATHPQKNYYYNLMIRYFSNAQYPYILPFIDNVIDPTKMITNEDVLFYEFRKSQSTLLGKVAPKIATATGENFLEQTTSTQKIVVFIGGNTPFSQQGLSQLYEKTKTQANVQVYAILLTDNPESRQNFKALFPNWLHFETTKEVIEPIAKAYSLYYTPTLFILDNNNVISKEQLMFE
jgi:hypothetical protein